MPAKPCQNPRATTSTSGVDDDYDDDALYQSVPKPNKTGKIYTHNMRETTAERTIVHKEGKQHTPFVTWLYIYQDVPVASYMDEMCDAWSRENERISSSVPCSINV